MNVKSVYIIIGFFISTDVIAKGIYSKTFGNYEHAVCDYLIVNNENAKVQVLGFKKDSEQAMYQNRDHVGYYIGMYGPEDQLILREPEITYSHDGFYVHDIGYLDRIKLGMFVSTISEPRIYGRIVSINPSQKFVGINSWYEQGKNVNGIVPRNSVQLLINSADKIWGQNTNIFLTKNSSAKTATGYELGFFSDGTHGNPVWGFHAVNLSNLGQPFQQAFRATGRWVTGFYSSSDIDVAFSADEPKHSALHVTNNINKHWKGSVIDFSSHIDTLPESYLIKSSINDKIVYSVRTDGVQNSGKFEVLRIAKNTILSIDGPSYIICNNRYTINLFLPKKNLRGVIYEVKANSEGVVRVNYDSSSIVLSRNERSYVKFINDGLSWIPLYSG